MRRLVLVCVVSLSAVGSWACQGGPISDLPNVGEDNKPPAIDPSRVDGGRPIPVSDGGQWVPTADGGLSVPTADGGWSNAADASTSDSCLDGDASLDGAVDAAGSGDAEVADEDAGADAGPLADAGC